MLEPRDELLGRLTDCLGTLVWAGTFIGHASGVSLVILHQPVVQMTWEELESSEDPVALARERISALATQ